MRNQNGVVIIILCHRPQPAVNGFLPAQVLQGTRAFSLTHYVDSTGFFRDHSVTSDSTRMESQTESARQKKNHRWQSDSRFRLCFSCL